MAWGRSDDTTTLHPRVIALASARDERQLNEAWGFIHRAFCWSSQNLTDGFIPEAIVLTLAGSRATSLVRVAQQASILGPKEKDPELGMRGWRLILDLDDLLHLRTKAEVTAERDYRAQLRDPEEFGPVRLRDGDQCRYCGVIVRWKDNTSARGALLDHVVKGEPEMVVSCRKCNGIKGSKTLEEAGLTLKRPPKNPYFSDYTRKLLTRHGFAVPPNQTESVTQPQARADEEVDDAATGAHSTVDTDDAATGAQSVATGVPPPQARSGDQSESKSGAVARGLPDQVPPGRVGSGLAGPGRAGPGGVESGGRAASTRPRGSRGRRSGSGAPDDE